MILAGILTAEVAFWVVLVAALTLRYAVRRRSVSTALLLLLPVIDLALLGLVATDLARGAAPSSSHALAAYYLGFTVAFGHPLVRWVDSWFAYRFAGGDRPRKPPKGSAAYVRSLWVEWFRVVVAAVITMTVLALLTVVARQGGESAEPLIAQAGTLAVVVVIWFLAGPAFERARRPGSDQVS